jgi:hypothetical protein
MKVVVSLFLLFHFGSLAACWYSQRDYSFLLDDYLGRVSAYVAFGNWRPDLTPLPIAGSTPLTEELKVELHLQGTDKDSWKKLTRVHPTDNRSSAGSPSPEVSRRWFMQLNGLLYHGNEDLVGRMMSSAVLAEAARQKGKTFDQVRITVALRPNQDQFEQLKSGAAGSETRDALQPRTFYTASIIDLGDEQISLLPQLEQRRASKSLLLDGNGPAK